MYYLPLPSKATFSGSYFEGDSYILNSIKIFDGTVKTVNKDHPQDPKSRHC